MSTPSKQAEERHGVEEPSVTVLVSRSHVWLRVILADYVPDPAIEPNSRPGHFEEPLTPTEAREYADRILAVGSPSTASLAEDLRTAADHVERHMPGGAP